MGNVLIVDMRHYLGEEPPSAVVRLRDHLGSIVEAVTLRDDTEDDYATQVICRRWPGHKSNGSPLRPCTLSFGKT